MFFFLHKTKKKTARTTERRKPDDIYIYALTQNENNYYNINYTGFGIERIDTNKAEENVFSRTAKY